MTTLSRHVTSILNWNHRKCDDDDIFDDDSIQSDIQYNSYNETKYWGSDDLIISSANIAVNNITTGNNGNVYILERIEDDWATSKKYFATNILLSNGDVVEWISTNEGSIQNPIFSQGAVPYSELLCIKD